MAGSIIVFIQKIENFLKNLDAIIMAFILYGKQNQMEINLHNHS